MAKSYLGKISALVTANTSDFNRKLDESAQRTRSFAASVKSQINAAERAASKSLDGIYTSLQKVERALSAAGGRRLSLIDDREANKIRQLVSAAEEVYRPLERAAKASEKLGADVRANFQPALIAAQKSAESLNRVIESGGTVGERSFQRIRRQVELTAESIDRLSEVQAEVGRLATGRELRFSRPSVAAALEDARASQQRLDARGASGAARVGRMGSGEIVQRQIEAANQVEAAFSRFLAARSEQASNRFRSPGNVAAAEDALDDRVAALNRVTAELNAQQDILDQQVAREEELAAAERRRADAAREFASFQDRVKQAVSGTPQTIGQAQQQFEKLAATIGKLNPAGQGAVQPLVDELLGLFSAASAGDDVLSNVIVKLNQLRDAADSAALLGNPSGPFGPPEPPGVGVFPTFPGDANGEATVALPPGFGGSSSAGLGAEIGDPTRQLDSFRAQIVAIKAQVDSLPESIRGRFIPDVQALEAAFRSASAAPEEFAGSLSVINGELQKTASNVSKALSASQAFATSVSDAFESTQVRSYAAQLSVLQGLLVRAGLSSGEAADEVDRLAGLLQEAASESGGLKRRADEIAKAFAAAARQVAEATGTGAVDVVARLKAASDRSSLPTGRGDISRGAAGNAQLAIQQLTFAIDDFFSVTGSLDQRIRAVGNNISQLGFILGGTEGLVLGVAASITAQLLVGLSRWANGTELVEQRTKALNDGISRQKSAVESLAAAYKNLADEIQRSGRSERDQQGVSIRNRVQEIQQLAEQARKENIAAFSPEAAQIRAQRGILEKRLEAEQNVEKRLRLEAEIERNKREEEIAVSRGIRLSPQDTQNTARAAREEQLRVAQVRLNRARLRRQLGGAEVAGENVEDLEQLVRERRRRVDELAQDPRQAGGASGKDQLSLLREERNALEAERKRVEELRNAPGARGRNQDFNPKPLDDAIDAVSVQIRRLETALSPRVQGIAQVVNQTSLAIAGGLDQIISRAAELGSVRISRQAGALADALAEANRRLAEATSEEEAAAIQTQVTALEGQQRALESVTNSLTTFKDVLDRISGELVNTVAQEARSAADQARRDANERPDDAFLLRRRQRLERDARRSDAERNEVLENNQRRRDDFERSARGGQLGDTVTKLVAERDAMDAIIRGEVAASEQQVADARRRRDEIDRILDRRFEDSAEGQAAAAEADRADQAQAARRRLDEDIQRGREVSQTQAERAGRQLADDLRGLQAAFDENPAGRPGDLAADQQRVINEALRSTAPAIFGLADQVQNAVLQGPSRAALQASDVTTAQGAAELNRLLRGDDSARNQDLVELQKQSNSLEELVRIARESGAPPGVLDL